MAYTQQLFDSLRRSRVHVNEPTLEASLATPNARSRAAATPGPLASLSGAPAQEDLHSVISLQKSQLAHLHSRVEVLEDQVSQVRFRCLCIFVQALVYVFLP